jgi:hypothetical protein
MGTDSVDRNARPELRQPFRSSECSRIGSATPWIHWPGNASSSLCPRRRPAHAGADDRSRRPDPVEAVGIGADDIDFARVHDSISIAELLCPEAMK